MNQIKTKTWLILTLFFFNLANVFANDTRVSDRQRSVKISGELSLSAESDNNVTVDEIDNDLALSDTLWTLSANFKYRQKLKHSTELKVSASHSQDRHDNFSEFDLTTNFVSADLSRKFTKLSTGATLRYITADLNSQNFLSLPQASLYVSTLLHDKVFLRVEYAYTDKTFDTFADRNATQHSLGTELYLFLAGPKRYLVAEYKYQNEDAASAQFDRQIHNLKLGYQHTFSIFERDLIGRLKASYQTRDYDAITPSIGVIRDDKRLRLGAELRVLLSPSLFALLEYQHSNYESNLPAADYKQDTVALKIGWQFGQ